MTNDNYNELALMIGQAVALGMQVTFRPRRHEQIEILLNEKGASSTHVVALNGCQLLMKSAVETALANHYKL